MELEKFARQLRLMVMLTQNRVVTVEEISEALGMSKRSIYRYIDLFRSMGFIVIKQGTCYRIDHTSPFRKVKRSQLAVCLTLCTTILWRCATFAKRWPTFTTLTF